MIATIIILIATLVSVPVAAFYLDDPLTAVQVDILWVSGIMCASVALTCFAVSELTRNCSQVDKLWSIVPIAYAWQICCMADCPPRMVVMATLVTVWGARLTYNFSRRGAYSLKFWSGEEDYRWGVLRKNPALNTPVKWFLFNLFFISLYQNGLILMFTLPILYVQPAGASELYWADYLVAGAMFAFIVMETIADQQQWNYQTEKHRRLKAGEPLDGIYAKGFTHTGLWAWVRHPNYASEQAIWICFYFFTVSATGHWLNWSITGCLLLLVLFQGSSDFSEGISAGKYAEYKEYQKKTGRFLPKVI